jgi:hypothetical protein
MIRVWIQPDTIYIGGKAYGFDVSGFEDKPSESGFYDNLLTEDLLERVDQGDIIMYFDSRDLAEEWCESHHYEYIYVEPEDDNN